MKYRMNCRIFTRFKHSDCFGRILFVRSEVTCAMGIKFFMSENSRGSFKSINHEAFSKFGCVFGSTTQDASDHQDYDLFSGGKAYYKTFKFATGCMYWVGIRSKVCPNFLGVETPQICYKLLAPGGSTTPGGEG